MSQWTRAELEDAFAHHQELSQQAAASGDWRAWADQFTEDAVYIEHFFGRLEGREAIYEWIQTTMNEWPGSEMTQFLVEWYIIDEERGWVVWKVWNHMADPGDGSDLRTYNFSLLKYAGDGLWSYEEDIYNPNRFIEMLEDYEARKAALAAGAERASSPGS